MCLCFWFKSSFNFFLLFSVYFYLHALHSANIMLKIELLKYSIQRFLICNEAQRIFNWTKSRNDLHISYYLTDNWLLIYRIIKVANGNWWLRCPWQGFLSSSISSSIFVNISIIFQWETIIFFTLNIPFIETDFFRYYSNIFR